jgi:hypothetical protein
MLSSEVDPHVGPPPRNVQPWTRVEGHTVVRGRERSFCSCGWDYRGSEQHRAVHDHVESAWPRLLPRLSGEGVREWRNRVAAAHERALLDRERIWREDGMGVATPPGHPYPVLSERYRQADDRVEVLQWQLDHRLTAISCPDRHLTHWCGL